MNTNTCILYIDLTDYESVNLLLFLYYIFFQLIQHYFYRCDFHIPNSNHAKRLTKTFEQLYYVRRNRKRKKIVCQYENGN